ncbi:MAG: DNA methyltransferase, partial [Brevinema sp.]
MAIRLLEMKRILKDTGSIYLHCDNTMGHYLKLLLDVIFGENNFRNEIIWCYRQGGRSNTDFSRKHDTIFRYSKTGNLIFNADAIRVPYEGTGGYQTSGKGVLNKQTGTIYKPNVLGKIPEDWWDIPAIPPTSAERIGYPTQKPLALLERIIKASCPEGGIVLDPFCGCATTCVAAEKLERNWIGIDISKKAFELVKIRLRKEIANPNALFQHKNTLLFRDDIPHRTDIDAKKLTGKYKKEIKINLYGNQAGICAGCKDHFRIENLAIDHIIPQAKGGFDNEDNLQLLCTYCNSIKGDRPMEYLLSKIEEVRRTIS